MKIEIVTKNVKNESMIREFIQRKVDFALERLNSRIERITVRLEDETKNSTHFDGACRIDLALNPRGNLHVSANGESPFDCILQAVRKMEHAVKHEIDRHRRSSSIRHQKGKRSATDAASEIADQASP